jgi:selT/selW/selH-like putative selenoprotein
LAADLKRTHGLDAELIKGSDGVFDVVIDGDKVFSKWEEGRFPDNLEILDEVAHRKSGKKP